MPSLQLTAVGRHHILARAPAFAEPSDSVGLGAPVSWGMGAGGGKSLGETGGSDQVSE